LMASENPSFQNGPLEQFGKAYKSLTGRCL
jgi:hypothetical protein